MNSDTGFCALSVEEAARYALTMSDLEREVIKLCSTSSSLGYSRLAEKIGASYRSVQTVGRSMQAKKLAHIRPVRCGDEYNGSALFLNRRGGEVKHALEKLDEIRSRRLIR